MTALLAMARPIAIYGVGAGQTPSVQVVKTLLRKHGLSPGQYHFVDRAAEADPIFWLALGKDAMHELTWEESLGAARGKMHPVKFGEALVWVTFLPTYAKFANKMSMFKRDVEDFAFWASLDLEGLDAH
jgi:hypothetical protein